MYDTAFKCVHLEPIYLHLELYIFFIQQEKKLYEPTYLYLEPTYLPSEPSNVFIQQVKPLNCSVHFWSLLLMS